MNTDIKHITRRQFIQALGIAATNPALADSDARVNEAVEYGKSTLPLGVRSRQVDTNNGVVLHILEAGSGAPAKPCVVLVHGFPELAYMWRHQLLPLSRAGFHVVAPDVRGYGRSVQKPVTFDDPILPYSMPNRVGDILGLVRAPAPRCL